MLGLLHWLQVGQSVQDGEGREVRQLSCPKEWEMQDKDHVAWLCHETVSQVSYLPPYDRLISAKLAVEYVSLYVWIRHPAVARSGSVHAGPSTALDNILVRTHIVSITTTHCHTSLHHGAHFLT